MSVQCHGISGCFLSLLLLSFPYNMVYWATIKRVFLFYLIFETVFRCWGSFSGQRKPSFSYSVQKLLAIIESFSGRVQMAPEPAICQRFLCTKEKKGTSNGMCTEVHLMEKCQAPNYSPFCCYIRFPLLRLYGIFKVINKHSIHLVQWDSNFFLNL